VELAHAETIPEGLTPASCTMPLAGDRAAGALAALFGEARVSPGGVPARRSIQPQRVASSASADLGPRGTQIFLSTSTRETSPEALAWDTGAPYARAGLDLPLTAGPLLCNFNAFYKIQPEQVPAAPHRVLRSNPTL